MKGAHSQGPETKLCPQRQCPCRTVSTLLSCSWPVNLAKPLRPVLLGLQSTSLVFQEPCEQLASISGAATERPYSEGLSSTLAPPPFSLWQSFSASYCGFSHHRCNKARSWESWEKWTKAFFKESNHKVLLLEILFVICNFYIFWGKGFHCMWGPYWWILVRETSGLHPVAQWLCLSSA